MSDWSRRSRGTDFARTVDDLVSAPPTVWEEHWEDFAEEIERSLGFPPPGAWMDALRPGDTGSEGDTWVPERMLAWRESDDAWSVAPDRPAVLVRWGNDTHEIPVWQTSHPAPVTGAIDYDRGVAVFADTGSPKPYQLIAYDLRGGRELWRVTTVLPDRSWNFGGGGAGRVHAEIRRGFVYVFGVWYDGFALEVYELASGERVGGVQYPAME